MNAAPSFEETSEKPSGGGRDEARRGRMAVIARASRAALASAYAGCPDRPALDVIRRPEVGLVMVPGRIGGAGAPFYLGEVTVTRAAVRLDSGELGFSCVMGRDKERALLAAALDALAQSPAHAEHVETALLAPERDRLAAVRTETQAKAAATRVEFFTMVRGED